MTNRFAKIVATMGPSCDDENILKQMIIAGMDVARLNFSHGTHEDHARKIKLLRKLSNECGKSIAILQDLQGPKLRIGSVAKEGIPLSVGQEIIFSSSANPDPAETRQFIPFDVPDLHKAVSAGNRILMDDGNLEIEVIEVTGELLVARVLLPGVLKSHKGVNLPNANLNIPALTEKDLIDLEFGLNAGIDIVAISFVKEAQDILSVKQAIEKFKPNHRVPVIAKLERPEALDNLESIMVVTDGVMVARGDLGVEMSPAAVPIAQKEIIQSANRHSKMVITATQMLDSMINNPRPTRAESTDVANAIFDGTDAVMLSGETAAGKYPLETIQMMDSIVREAEIHIHEWGQKNTLLDNALQDDSISMEYAACELAKNRNVAAIIVFTQSGKTALLMSKARPTVPIYAFTPELDTYQRMGLMWGVTPLLVPFADTLETLIAHVETAIATSTTLKAGQKVVLIAGFPVGALQLPNLALLYTLGSL